jgi:hypothetical protein
MLIKVANKDTEGVVTALIKHVQKLPRELYQSLTWDRGKELADHQRLKLATDIEVYFCDPRSPWQRGSNENTNRLLRQYLPRGHRPRSAQPSQAQRQAAQRASEKALALSNTRGEVRRVCCSDLLNPPRMVAIAPPHMAPRSARHLQRIRDSFAAIESNF